jgi:parallel beta-helix repeat protein
MLFRATAIAAFVLAGSLTLAVGPAAAHTTTAVKCGQTLTHSVKLAKDLVNCPGDGLVLGADNITVDLHGHVIDGVSPPTTDCNRPPFGTTGINNDGGFDRITVKDGTVREFDNGIGGGFGHSRLTRLVVRANTFAGIAIGSRDPEDDLDANTIDHNAVDGNSCGGGIELTQSHHSVVAHNRVTNVPRSAIDLVTGGENRVEHNTVRSSGDGVTLVFDSDGNRVQDNTITDGGGGINLLGPASGNTIRDNRVVRIQFVGILIESADFAPGAPTGNRIADNHVISAGNGIILFEAEQTRVSRNAVLGAGKFGDPEEPGFGIWLDGVSHSVVDRNSVAGSRGPGISIGAAADENPSALAPTGNVVSENSAGGGDADGIRIVDVAVDTTVERNDANHNGGDGINVQSPSTTITRNAANRNADYGIEAVPGVADGGGNHARRNGNPAQCIGVTCN